MRSTVSTVTIEAIANNMNVTALLNHARNAHDSPAAERFYRLQLQQSLRQPILHRSPAFQPRPEKPREPELTRDQRLEIRTLRKYNRWSYITLARETGHTVQQVQKACTGPLTPKKKGTHMLF